MADKVDPVKAFEAIARILSDREHVEIRVASIEKKTEESKESAAG